MSRHSVILMVDDDPVSRNFLSTLLPPQGYELFFADSREQASEVVVQKLPDLVLIGLTSGTDSIGLCRDLRAHPSLAELPIILSTTQDNHSLRLEALEAGVDDFLTKPFDQTELLARLRTIVRLNRFQQLHADRLRFERVIQLSPNGVMIVIGSMIYLASQTMARMIGVQLHELHHVDVERYLPGLHAQIGARLASAIEGQPTCFESMLLRPGNDVVPVEIDAGYIQWGSKNAIQIVVRDISDRKHMEALSRRQTARLNGLRTIDKTIASSTSLHVTLNVVMDQIIELLHVSSAALLLRRPHTLIFDYTILRGAARQHISMSSVQIGNSYAGRVVMERRTLTFADLAPLDLVSPLSPPPAVYIGVPVMVKGQIEGVIEIFHHEPMATDTEWMEFLEILVGQVGVAIDHAALFESMQRANAELSITYTTTLEGWARALELRDKETEGHSQRVTEMTIALAQTMGLRDSELVHIRRGALLHDIGKMGVPDSILNKPDKLTDEEWQVMRQHPVFAYELLKPIPYLGPTLDIPYCHHERWDGTGYPRGLKGEAIPIAARIFAVADVWDALRFDRPYRKGWPEEQVREYIRSESGTHFDPQVVAAFLQLQQSQIGRQRLAVLIVDDESQITFLIQRVLQDMFKIFTASSSEEALRILAEEQIAVVLTDQRMPKMTGVQLMERVKHVSPTTLGILISAHFDNLALTDALNLGNIRGFIHKPWDNLDLRRRVNEVAQQFRDMSLPH